MDFLIDIGNVLLTFDFGPAFQRLAPAGSEDTETKFAQLIERKDDFEAGRIGADEYVLWASEVLGFQGSPEEFSQTWCEIFTPNPPMWDLMRELKKRGHRLIIFSNTNELHGPFVLREFPEFSIFDGLVFSYEAGEIKPERKIYDYAIEQFGLTPAQTFYFDDLPANIQTGTEYGIKSFQYDSENHEAALTWLREQRVL